VPIRIFKEYNKEKKSWWTYPQGGGEPRISCVMVSLCNVLMFLCVCMFRFFDIDE
jgi:hypothetical protein